MKRLYRYFLTAPKTGTLAALALGSLIFNLWATSLLNVSYAASRFPVPYYEAQLSFSADKIKGWYDFLIRNGTLERYLSTQHIDSVFIVSTLLLHTFVLVLISRRFGANSKGRSVMVSCALLSALAPVFDQLENLVSYVMLADPSGFPGALALIYSSFAALKFAMFVFAYSAATIGLVWGVMAHALRSSHRTAAKPSSRPEALEA